MWRKATDKIQNEPFKPRSGGVTIPSPLRGLMLNLHLYRGLAPRGYSTLPLRGKEPASRP